MNRRIDLLGSVCNVLGGLFGVLGVAAQGIVHSPTRRPSAARGRRHLDPISIGATLPGSSEGNLDDVRFCHLEPEASRHLAATCRIRAGEDWHTKNHRDRSVPLRPDVRRAIEARPVGLYVFRGPRGGKPRQNHTLKCLKEDRRKLRIHKGVLHSFRHFSASVAGSVEGRARCC
jgi:hypothetical protein